MKKLVLLIVLCASIFASAQQKPNVLFLIVDDMNDYGFYETVSQIKMPYLNKFKESAVVFENANCGSPVCTPSRAAVFSGLFPHHTGAYFNGCDPWNKSEKLKQQETLPEMFKRNGYETFGRGKLYHAQLSEGRIEKNFDNRPIYGGGFGPFPDEEHQIKGKFWGIQAFPDSIFPDVKNANAAIEFLQQDHDKPFFLALGLWRPHTPFTCPQRFYDMYDMNDIELPKGYNENDLSDIPEIAKELLDPFGRFNPKNKQEWKELIRAYFACTTFADWSVGRVIETLDNSKYAENTIVVFWSDNGYHCGEKNHWEKNTLWEQAAKTPMAIRVPGVKENGKHCFAPVSSVDLYPTLTELCNLNQKSKTDGKSLKPLLDNVELDWKPALTTFGEGFASVRDKRFRYIRYSDGSEELYDHLNDPYEWNNIQGKHAVQRIKLRLGKYIPEKFAKELQGRKN
ncbi:sulfatase [Draconibacterium sediminis]|uniref:sulfatase n=1 Tax=Draconibacterium sediminis TaxID=1544798 RepID=UPI0006967856|nr:sulfatase [Draconibacterium sediminis]